MNVHIYAKGPNLFDAATNTVTTGKYINSEGVEKTSSGSGKNKLNHTDYMSVTPGHQYKYKWSGPALTASTTTASIALFDENLDFISRPVEGQYPSSTASFELDLDSVPNNAAYAILNFPSATWPNSDVNIEFYDKTLAWRDYTPHSYHGAWHNGTSYSYDKRNFDLTGTNTNNGYVDEYFLKNDGTKNLSTTGLWAITEYQEIPSGASKLTIKTNGNNNAAICFYKSTMTFTSGVSYSSTGSQTINIPANGAKYFRMSIKKDEISSFEAKTYNDVWNP